MAQIRLKYVTQDTDRHGNLRFYFRKRGMKNKIRLPGFPGSSEFMAAYNAALNGETPQPAAPKNIIKATPKTSFKWLCLQYMASHAFKNNLDTKTQYNYQRMLTKICDEPIADGICVGDAPFASMTAQAIRKIRDRWANTPNEANSVLKVLRALFKWAVPTHCEANPASGVERLKVYSEGHHAWSVAEVRQFENVHPIGSKARLALALLLFTGQRLSDVIRLGRHMIEDGCFCFVQHKGRKRKPSEVTLPILPELASIIAQSETGEETFLVGSRGQVFTENRFGKVFREWCDEAGLPHCSAHGLRKAGATIAANNGATASQLMAIFGWRDIKQAELYTRKADRKRLAKAGMHLIAVA